MTVTDLKQPVPLESAVVRFCGDSGDGMQLAGMQLTNTSALLGNDVATFPDFPAEIRAPRGTRAGVSGYQIHFASRRIFTPGDKVDALVALNPAALATNLGDLRPGGALIVNRDAFTDRELDLAGYDTNPLENGSLDAYQLFHVEMTKLTRLAVKDFDLPTSEADRCRNFFAMGLVYWLYDRPLESTERFIEERFGRRPRLAEANRRVLHAGYHYGETTEAFARRFAVGPAALPPGRYRNVTGNQALAWGLMAAAKLSNRPLFLGSYPITPASDILHELARRKNFGVRTFQAEDEIAAMTSAVGAAFGGAMAVTCTSGPGMMLKGEGLNLAVMTELPLLVVDIQRAGPSTGMPTKTEQADLSLAVFGRAGQSPLPVLAARSPADCFEVAIEAWRIAVRYMTPVVLLSDGSLANGSEAWRIPAMAELAPIEIPEPQPPSQPNRDREGAAASTDQPSHSPDPNRDREGATVSTSQPSRSLDPSRDREGAEPPPFAPYARNDRLARPWALPGTPGLEHRIGGLEKRDVTGNVDYSPENHERMVALRQAKIDGVVRDVPPQTVEGPEQGKLLVLGWGGTYGVLATAAAQLRGQNASVAHAHLRYLNPLPDNLGELLQRYDRVLVVEQNLGQLLTIIRDRYQIDAVGFHRVTGRPLGVEEVVESMKQLLEP